MLRSTFFGLEIGRTGLTTSQFNLDVTSHNISNVNTVGYTRQRTVTTAHDPFSTIGRVMPANDALVGGGTRVMVLDQIRSAYLDRRFRTENTQHAYFETRTQSLSYVRSFFNHEDTSINQNLADFFRAMTTVAANPASAAPRTSLQTSAKDMVQQFNMIHEGLMNLQAVENTAVRQKTYDINRMAEQLSQLNVSIYRFEVTGMIANDLRDQRNLLLDNLSRLIDIDYEEVPCEHNPNDNMLSTMTVWIGGRANGVELVNHDAFNTLGVALVTNDIEGGVPIAIPYWTHLVGDINDIMDEVDVNRLLEMDPGDPAYAGLRADYERHLEALFGDGPGTGVQRWQAWERTTDIGDAAALNMSRITGGELKAHIDVRDGVGNGADSTKRGIPYFTEQVNHLARALLQEINAIHTVGWTNNPNGSRTNVNFFAIRDENGDPVNVGGWAIRDTTSIPPSHTPLVAGVGGFTLDPDTGAWLEGGDPVDLSDPRFIFYVPNLQNVTARNITLSEDVDRSSFNIAASSVRIARAGEGDAESLQQGNNVNIRAMNELFRATTIVLWPRIEGQEVHIGGFDNFATSIRFAVGNTMNSAESMERTSRILTIAAENQRTAIAGVSLDEEMVRLVRYQHAFNGAARVITTMDDALDRIINGMGRVGL